MLPAGDVRDLARLIARNAPDEQVQARAHAVRMRLNPNPAGQLVPNTLSLDGRPLPGVQHDYTETVLFSLGHGQTAAGDIDGLVTYLRRHPEVTSVLITGGDPMFMGAQSLRRYLTPLLDPSLEHLESIRIGTRSLAYWPQRYVTDPDADATLRQFEEVADSGRHLAVMAYFSHPRELAPALEQEAARRITASGAVIRTQAPLIRAVDDEPETWRAMWRAQLRQGMVPYYMFVERDTGPQDYFAVPLASGYEIFRNAFGTVSGLARTVRGPSMSAAAGKIGVDGIADVGGNKVFVLRMIQARDPFLVGRQFFAHFDPAATWITGLQPAFAPSFPYSLSPREAARPVSPPACPAALPPS